MISGPASGGKVNHPLHGHHTWRRKKSGIRSFTLVEMLTAMAVMLLILLIIAAATNGARSTMQRSQNDLTAFAVARSAFETMSDKLSMATLNTYWDYYDSAGLSRGAYAAAGVAASFKPDHFGRASDLHFLIQQNTQETYYGQEVYFQTPVAYSVNSGYQDTQGLLNACSYFIEYCPDSYRPGSDTTPRWRYRLMQGLEPTEDLQVYANVATNLLNAYNGVAPTWTWNANIKNDGGSGTLKPYVVPIADNVIALIVWPRLPLLQDNVGNVLTTSYLYDSQTNIQNTPATVTPPINDQLPPILQVTMVVIDEASAIRAAATVTGSTEPANIKSALSSAPSKFTKSDLTDYEADLSALTNALNAARPPINYRVLTSYVVMRESKWSQ